MTRCLAAVNAPRNRSRVNVISSFAVYYRWECGINALTHSSERKAGIGFPAKQMLCIGVLVIIMEIIYEKSYCSDRRGSR